MPQVFVPQDLDFDVKDEKRSGSSLLERLPFHDQDGGTDKRKQKGKQTTRQKLALIF